MTWGAPEQLFEYAQMPALGLRTADRDCVTRLGPFTSPWRTGRVTYGQGRVEQHVDGRCAFARTNPVKAEHLSGDVELGMCTRCASRTAVTGRLRDDAWLTVLAAIGAAEWVTDKVDALERQVPHLAASESDRGTADGMWLAEQENEWGFVMVAVAAALGEHHWADLTTEPFAARLVRARACLSALTDEGEVQRGAVRALAAAQRKLDRARQQWAGVRAAWLARTGNHPSSVLVLEEEFLGRYLAARSEEHRWSAGVGDVAAAPVVAREGGLMLLIVPSVVTYMVSGGADRYSNGRMLVCPAPSWPLDDVVGRVALSAATAATRTRPTFQGAGPVSMADLLNAARAATT